MVAGNFALSFHSTFWDIFVHILGPVYKEVG